MLRRKLFALLFAALSAWTGQAHAADYPPAVIISGSPVSLPAADTLVDPSGFPITKAGPVRTAAPDGVAAFYTYTTNGTSNCFTASGGSFTSGDVGKYITVKGIGNSTTEWTFTSTITSVASGSSICTAATPPRALSAYSALTYYGTDQATKLQAAFTAGSTSRRGSRVTGGIYLVASPLVCLPPALPWNNTYASPPLCDFDQGAVLLYVGTNPTDGAFITFGSTQSDYSGYLREAVVEGGTIDCNHICGIAESFPFFKHLKRSHQKTKNALWAGVRYNDSKSGRAASGGIVDRDNDYEWETPGLAISNLSKAVQPVVTTSQPHGITSPRFVSMVGVMTQDPTYPSDATKSVALVPEGVSLTFWATIDDATHLRLHNVNGSAWPDYKEGGRVHLALPAYRKPIAFYTASTASPTVVTTEGTNSTSGSGGFIQNGDRIDVYNVGSTGGVYDGTYTACNLSGSGGDGNYQFSLYTVDTDDPDAPPNPPCTTPVNGSGITVTGAGWLYKSYGLVNKHHPENAGVWLDLASDAEFHANTINGAVVGIYAPDGYDQKWVANHNWNGDEHGPMLFSGILKGDNSLIGEQQDCPAWLGYKFLGPNNSIMGSEVNCAVFRSNVDSIYTWLRLDAGASATVWGGRIKGKTFARPQFEVSDASVAGSPTRDAGHPNYKRFGLDTGNTIFPVSDTYRWNLTGSTTGTQAQATTRYLGANGAQATAVNSTWLSVYPGRARTMTIQVDTTPAAGQTFAFTARNGAASLGACTIASGSFACSATLEGYVSPGNNLYIQSVFSATSGSANVRYSLGFDG